MFERKYCFGIYKYVDKETGNIVYIGKDSHIDKNRRHREHISPSKYNEQKINKVVQNHPERYTYDILETNVPNEDSLNVLEMKYIDEFDPKFNFTRGGNGALGYVPTEEARRRISAFHNGKKLSEETKEKIRQAKLGTTHTKETRLKLSALAKGRILTQNHKEKVSKGQNSSGFFCVYKRKDNTCRQGFLWAYQYYENKKRKSIKRIDLFELKKEVELRGLVWKVIDIDNAVETVRSIHSCF